MSTRSEKDYYSPPAPFANSPGIIRVTRDLPPAHYSIKVDSFSLFTEVESIEKHESGVFEAGGYKWRLILYPNGNKKSNGDGCISLYLQIVETETFPLGWQVNVNFKLFVLDQIRDKYLTIEDAGTVKRFHQMRTEWGIDQFLLLECFNDATNGYLVNDCCIFGAEVFVIEQKGGWECLSMIKKPAGNPISFKLEKFSKLKNEFYESPLQSIAGFKWNIRVYPRGVGSYKDKALCLFLSIAEAPGVPPKRSFYVKYKLRLMNQISSNHREFSAAGWFITDKHCRSIDDKSVSNIRGNSELLENVCNASKGFLVKDTLIVEAEIVFMSKPITCSS